MSDVKGNKDDGAVVDINNDQQDYEKNHNSGGSGIVVMRGGKPELAGRGTNIVRGVLTKEELEAKQKEEDGEMAVRVTMLPDALDPDGEEREIEIVRARKNMPKQITRVDVTLENLESETSE